MTKSEATKIFGTPAAAARILGLGMADYNRLPRFSRGDSDRLLGAALRLKKISAADARLMAQGADE